MAINRLKDPPTWLKVATTLENPTSPRNTHMKLWKQNIAKTVSKRIFQIVIRWLAWTGRYSYWRVQSSDEWFSLYRADKQIFVNQCYNRHGTVIQYISQIYTFFVPNIKDLAQTVLAWEAKVAAADAETNWKHSSWFVKAPHREGTLHFVVELFLLA